MEMLCAEERYIFLLYWLYISLIRCWRGKVWVRFSVLPRITLPTLWHWVGISKGLNWVIMSQFRSLICWGFLIIFESVFQILPHPPAMWCSVRSRAALLQCHWKERPMGLHFFSWVLVVGSVLFHEVAIELRPQMSRYRCSDSALVFPRSFSREKFHQLQ